MSTDVQDRDLAGRKRSHGDFLNQESCGAAAFRDSEHIQADHSLSDKENDARCTSLGASASPAARSSSVLSEPACSPIDPSSPPPNPTSAPPSASTAPSSTMAKAKATTKNAAGEPPKKKRATKAEKAARDAEAEADKRKREAEREKKRQEREEAEKQKAQQKAAKAEEKAAKAAALAEKEQEKKQRAEEREKKRREKEEEETKKTRSQMKLTSMFKTAPTTPKKEPVSSKPDEAQPAGTAATSEPKETSLYDQMFKPFFVKEHVRLARNALQMDDQTRQAKSDILDEYVDGKRKPPTPRFEPLEALQIPYKVRRGRVYPSVRKIMSELQGLSSSAPVDLTTESQTAQMRHTMEALKSVPVKSLKYWEDVRLPYIGTVSGLPTGVQSLQKLARKPISKILPLNYEYDSEAEWQEEEGEDVDDLDDDEEEVELDEDMEDFLDDSEDIRPARLAFNGVMEPESTGPCWEDRTRRTAEQKLYKYRMEFILEPLEHRHSIDPFSSAYWESPKPKARAGNEPSAASASTSTSATIASSAPSSAQDARANPMAPPPAPSDAFKALNPAAAPAGTKKSQQPLPLDMQQKLKDLVHDHPKLSKVGVIELFAAQNQGCPRSQVKTSFDALFEKSGKVFKVRGE